MIQSTTIKPDSGRYIGENIRTITEAIECAQNNDEPGLICFSDFHKAFDSLDHSFMFKTLKELYFRILNNIENKRMR